MDDGFEGFIIGFMVGVLFVLISVMLLVPTNAENTCYYFEERGYTIVTDDETCYLETEGGFLPVEDLIQLTGE